MFCIAVSTVVVSFEMEMFALITVSLMFIVTSGVVVVGGSVGISGTVCGCVVGVVVVTSCVGGVVG